MQSRVDGIIWHVVMVDVCRRWSLVIVIFLFLAGTSMFWQDGTVCLLSTDFWRENDMMTYETGMTRTRRTPRTATHSLKSPQSSMLLPVVTSSHAYQKVARWRGWAT